jgi:hypothetical protein
MAAINSHKEGVMGVWRLTTADRDDDGKIKISTFDSEIARALQDIDAGPSEPPRRAAEGTRTPMWMAHQYLAIGAALLMLAVALVLLVSKATPAQPAPRPVVPAPTASAAVKPTSTVTPVPTATATVEPPTEAPAVVIVEPTPCDPLTAPYQERRQIGPIGSVVGISCSSAGEAQANAEALAGALIATATAQAKP